MVRESRILVRGWRDAPRSSRREPAAFRRDRQLHRQATRRYTIADAAVFVGFGQPARAREPQALEVWEEAVRLYTELHESGEIESFEPVLLEPHGGDLAGFFLVRGDQQQIERLRAHEDFRRINTRAGLVVDGLGVVEAYIGSGLAAELAVYRDQMEKQLSA